MSDHEVQSAELGEDAMDERPEQLVFVINEDASVRREELVELYDAVGWAAYTNRPETLERAVQNSSRVVIARLNNELVGLARVISDGATIAYLQDVLVHPRVQRHNLGSELVRRAFAPYETVRQKVLITDDEPATRAFYESLGFTEGRDQTHPTLCFVKFEG